MNKDLKLPLWIIAVSLAVIALALLLSGWSMIGCGQMMAKGMMSGGMM